VGELIEEYHTKVRFFKASRSVKTDERLFSHLASKTRDFSATAPILQVIANHIVVRIPKYDTNNLGMKENLGKYLKWASVILGYDASMIRIAQDDTLGGSIALPTRINRFMDKTLACVVSIDAKDDRHEFPAGLKGNTAELIACIKVMRRYSAFVRKSSNLKKGVNPVSLYELKEVVNMRAGLKEPGLGRFEHGFIRSVLNECTKVNASHFPGEFIRSVRKTNEVSSNNGLLHKLGYEPKSLNPKKLLHVLLNRPVLETSETVMKGLKDKTLSSVTKDEIKVVVKRLTLENFKAGGSHQEAKACVVGCLPYINSKSEKPLKNQLSVDPLDLRVKNAIPYYSENAEFVQAVDMAYATLSSLGKKSSKATAKGYMSLRNGVLHKASSMKMLADDKYVSNLSDVSPNVRDYLFKLVFRKTKDKRSPEDDQALQTFLSEQELLVKELNRSNKPVETITEEAKVVSTEVTRGPEYRVTEGRSRTQQKRKADAVVANRQRSLSKRAASKKAVPHEKK